VVLAADQALLAWLAGARTGWLTELAEPAALLTSFAVVMGLRLVTVVVLVAYGRLRQLVVLLATLVVTDWVVVRLLFVGLPRPEVAVLVETEAYAFPSKAVSALAITVFSMAFVLVPGGGDRARFQAGATAVLALVVLARLYLAADYLSGMAYAVLLAPAVTAVGFRWLVPEEGFPVTYRRGGTAAHLDLGGERGAAIVRAMADQLAMTVTEVKAFGLEGSGGSSPLRMTLSDGSRVFGKIYSTSHERADRWYRLGRTILYGQLEDETPMGSVRRLATYEDYALRLLDDHGSGWPGPSAWWSSPPTRSTCWSPSSSRVPATWATPRSTTWSSTRACAWSGPSGTSAWPTATSSRPTCWSATATCSWSTCPGWRSARPRGGRPSTCPTCS
jgi:hypothetical protein